MSEALDRARRATETLSRGRAPQKPAAAAASPAPVHCATEVLSGGERAAAAAEAAAPLEWQAAVRDLRAVTFVAGNCAQWTSQGLVFAGLLRRSRLFPKARLSLSLSLSFSLSLSLPLSLSLSLHDLQIVFFLSPYHESIFFILS